MRDLNRTEIDILLFVGKANSAHGKSDDSDDDENNPYNCCGFHFLAPFLLIRMQTIATFLKTPGFIFHGVDLRVWLHAVPEGKLPRLEFRIPGRVVATWQPWV